MAEHRQYFTVCSRFSVSTLLTSISNRGNISWFHTHTCLLRTEHLSAIRALVPIVVKLCPAALINMTLLAMWAYQLTLQQRHGVSLCNTSGNTFNIGIARSSHRLHSFFDPRSSSIAALSWALGVFYGRRQSLAIWPYFPQL